MEKLRQLFQKDTSAKLRSKWDYGQYLERLQNAVTDINSNVLKAVNIFWSEVDFLACRLTGDATVPPTESEMEAGVEEEEEARPSSQAID
ncbi:hypothetical protein R1flu_015133 [Riccia fluitans]|uniref:Uncharacterized protein n=1 Tax=Riccia fluitans TaxID=41844 RepID=A0ABD1YL78_9MARC